MTVPFLKLEIVHPVSGKKVVFEVEMSGELEAEFFYEFCSTIEWWMRMLNLRLEGLLKNR